MSFEYVKRFTIREKWLGYLTGLYRGYMKVGWEDHAATVAERIEYYKLASK